MNDLPANDKAPRESMALSHGEIRFLLWSGIGILVLLFAGAAFLDLTHDGDVTAIVVAIVGVGGALVGAIVALFNKVSAVQGALNGDMDARVRTIVREELVHLRKELMERLDDFTAPPKRE